MRPGIAVAHLLSPSGLYGKEQWLLALLRHIDRDRFGSVVISLGERHGSPFPGRVRGAGVAYRTTRRTSRFDPRVVGEVSAMVRETGADILHTHDYKSDIIGFLVGRRTGITTLGTPHGWSTAQDLKLRLYQAVDRIALRRFDHVAPLSTQLYDSLHGVPVGRKTLIANFIDLETIPAHGGGDAKLFCFIGRLTDLKRVGDAIDALRYTENTDIRLCIVGDGDRREGLERHAARAGLSKRVSFNGFQPDPLSFVGGAAGLVIPSLTEGVSRVAMEAMAMAKPVIGTDIAGIRELIEDGRTGVLVPVRSPRAIARAMDRLAGDLALRAAIGAAAREYMVAERSAASIVPRYERLYERLVARASR